MATPVPPTDAPRLARSLLWQLQLGLLEPPTKIAASGTNHELLATRPLDQVVTQNAIKLEDHLARYEELRILYAPHLEQHKHDDLHHHHHGHEEEDAGGSEDDEDWVGVAEEEHDPNDNTHLATKAASDDDGSGAVDPLTAMLMEQQAQEEKRQELDLRYRKERARRKRGLAEPTKVVPDAVNVDDGNTQKKHIDHSTLNIIDKDLNRLPSPEDGTWRTPEFKNMWIQSLREILYLYAQEHPQVGYRQGMHEVASYLFLGLYLDRQQHQEQLPPEQLTLLFSEATAYFLLISILHNIRQAFDVKVASNSRPLEEMSTAVINKLKNSHADQGPLIAKLLESLSVPPEMYCTKWIRLLYSREITGSQNVLGLWDVFADLVAQGWQWMAILEATAASRILLQGPQLLHPDNHHNSIDLLMNMPPIDNTEALVLKLRHLLVQPQLQQAPSQQQQQTHPTYPLSGNHQGSQPNSLAPNFYAPNTASSTFSLGSLRQSLEQGVGKLSESSGSIRKKITTEWETFKQQQQQQQAREEPMTRSYLDPIFPMATMDPHSQPQTSPVYTAAGIRAHPTTVSVTPPFHTDDPLSNNTDLRHSMPQHVSPSSASIIGPAARNAQLADTLGGSVSILQNYVMAQTRSDSAAGSQATVPSAVWEALAEIEVVRRALLQHNI